MKKTTIETPQNASKEQEETVQATPKMMEVTELFDAMYAGSNCEQARCC